MWKRHLNFCIWHFLCCTSPENLSILEITWIQTFPSSCSHYQLRALYFYTTSLLAGGHHKPVEMILFMSIFIYLCFYQARQHCLITQSSMNPSFIHLNLRLICKKVYFYYLQNSVKLSIVCMCSSESRVEFSYISCN